MDTEEERKGIVICESNSRYWRLLRRDLYRNHARIDSYYGHVTIQGWSRMPSIWHPSLRNIARNFNAMDVHVFDRRKAGADYCLERKEGIVMVVMNYDPEAVGDIDGIGATVKLREGGYNNWITIHTLHSSTPRKENGFDSGVNEWRERMGHNRTWAYVWNMYCILNKTE